MTVRTGQIGEALTSQMSHWALAGGALSPDSMFVTVNLLKSLQPMGTFDL